MKDLIHKSIENSLNFVKFPFLQKIAKINVTIPFYHIVSDSKNELISNLYRYRTVNEFNNDLDSFQKYYQFIDIKQLLNFQKNRTKLPKNALLLTFDDGMREMYEIVAPILLKRGIPATFFLTTDFLNNKKLFFRNKVSLLIEYFIKNKQSINENSLKQIFQKYQVTFRNIEENLRQIKFNQNQLLSEIAQLFEIDFEKYLEKNKPYLTDNQILELIKSGFGIGAHSLNHTRYNEISTQEQITQTIESVNIIRNKYELDYGAFAFPFSDSGVSASFFSEISKSNTIDLVFSADGFLDDECLFNYHRFWMENTSKTAKQIVIQNIKEKLIRQAKGKNLIVRK